MSLITEAPSQKFPKPLTKEKLISTRNEFLIVYSFNFLNFSTWSR